MSVLKNIGKGAAIGVASVGGAALGDYAADKAGATGFVRGAAGWAGGGVLGILTTLLMFGTGAAKKAP